MLFSINEEDKTASVIDRISKTKDVLIPRSVKYQDRDFIVTSIRKHAFSNDRFLKTIRFSPDSEVRFIGDSAFQHSKIKNIEIPKSVCELNNSLCNGTPELTRVTVDPANKCYKNDEKNPNLILGKSDKKVTILMFLYLQVEIFLMLQFHQVLKKLRNAHLMEQKLHI